MTNRTSFDPQNPADMEEYRAIIAKEIQALDALADNSDLKLLLRSVENFRLLSAEDGFSEHAWGDTLIALDRLAILGNMAEEARKIVEQRAPWFVGSHARLFEHDDFYPWGEGEAPEGSDERLFQAVIPTGQT
jgi:hypothetical protein